MITLTKNGKLAMALATLASFWSPRSLAQTQAPTSHKRVADAPAETTLAREVHHQLQVLPFSSVFDYIEFTLDGSKVTLKGYVVRPKLKHDAAAAVRSIEGIGRVIDEIEVLPESESDDEIRRAMYRAIFENSALQKYAVQPIPSLRIIVKNGNASLEGTVESEGDKDLAGEMARGVAKVRDLKDNLVVRGNKAENKGK
jgi:osmotically-inducible protein OsmY